MFHVKHLRWKILQSRRVIYLYGFYYVLIFHIKHTVAGCGRVEMKCKIRYNGMKYDKRDYFVKEDIY